MPHYLIDRMTYDALENKCVAVEREVGAVVAASLTSAGRLVGLRYHAKSGDGLRYYQRLLLYAVRTPRDRDYVERKQQDDLKALADFAELMQTIVGAKPVKPLTTKETQR